MNKTEPVWLKVAQVATALQLSESSGYRMVRSGEIPVRWGGGRVRIHRNFIEEEAWIKNERTTTIFPQQQEKAKIGKTTPSEAGQMVVFPASSTLP